MTSKEIIDLALRHGASSYRNRADTQHPAYGFTETGLVGFVKELLAGQCLHQIQEPGPSHPAPAAVAVPMAEAWELSAADTEQWTGGVGQDYNQGLAEGLRICAKDLRAALAATTDATAPVVLPEPVAIALSKRESATKGTVEFTWKTDAFKIAGRHALYTEQQVRALLAGVSAPAAQAVEQAPVLYVSKGQLDNHRDPDGPDSTAHGRYLPARVTPAGKFTTPLFAAPQAQADALDAERYRLMKNSARTGSIGFGNDWISAEDMPSELDEFLDTLIAAQKSARR